MSTKEGGGFTAIKTHMQKCITLEGCIELFEGKKKQRKIVESKSGETSVHHRVVLDFIKLIVDENIPLSCCNKKKIEIFCTEVNLFIKRKKDFVSRPYRK